MPSVMSRLVEVCVFRFCDNHAEYLLLKRAPDDPLYPGLWQLVTGTLRDGETARAAAVREMREETRLHPMNLWVVPHINSFYDWKEDAVHLVPFFAAQVDPAAEPVLSREHVLWMWVRSAVARRRLVWPGQRQGVDLVEKYVLGGEEAAQHGMVPPA